MGSPVGWRRAGQLIAESDIEVTLLSSTQIKAILADNPLPIPFAETGLKQFQEQAFTTAYAGHYSR